MAYCRPEISRSMKKTLIWCKSYNCCLISAETWVDIFSLLVFSFIHIFRIVSCYELTSFLFLWSWTNLVWIKNVSHHKTTQWVCVMSFLSFIKCIRTRTICDQKGHNKLEKKFTLLHLFDKVYQNNTKQINDRIKDQ